VKFSVLFEVRTEFLNVFRLASDSKVNVGVLGSSSPKVYCTETIKLRVCSPSLVNLLNACNYVYPALANFINNINSSIA
jgi:hypothetical protein